MKTWDFYGDTPEGVHICEVEGCTEVAEAFCLTGKHFVCREHHKTFHTVDGHPLRGVKINVPWEWKK